MLEILFIIVIVGLLVWAVNVFIPMDDKIKKIFNVVVIIALVYYLLKAFGLIKYLQNL